MCATEIADISAEHPTIGMEPHGGADQDSRYVHASIANVSSRSRFGIRDLSAANTQ
jgi:hypothetical protein